MKNIVISLAAAMMLWGCKNSSPGKYTLKGHIDQLPDQHVVLEQLYFDERPPHILDSAAMSKGNFELDFSAAEEGMYRLRFSNAKNGYLFINDAPGMSFNANALDSTINAASFSGPANASFKNFMLEMQKRRENFMAAAESASQYELAHPNDSSIDQRRQAVLDIANKANDYISAYIDTVKSPTLAMFIMGYSGDLDTAKMRQVTTQLKKRFPDHKGIHALINRYEQSIAAAPKINEPNLSKNTAEGAIAPDITLNDPSGKPVSISSFKGKYLLVDFWASWCGPCRAANPHMVELYKKYKSKNLAVLGISLDEDKDAWVKAIAKDKLDWAQMSDLKGWNSEAAVLYGVEAIPHTILIDPSGKIVARDLQGAALDNALEKALQ